MLLRYTLSGHLYISPQDDCDTVVDAILATEYDEDFCIAEGFAPGFVARLMEAGFLVMSADIAGKDEEKPEYILLPKLHLERSALFFDNLHVKKSIRRYLSRYELRPDADFEEVIDRCVKKHEDDWLTPPLVECIKTIRRQAKERTSEVQMLPGNLAPTRNAYPASFALYRDGKLVAGEFGVVYGKVYTSYSGFYDENNAGTVQLILAARHLQEQGFTFLDLGMPLDYKTDLGAENISPEAFVALFRG
jgi:Leu/Phe-tRNA-protein transferase